MQLFSARKVLSKDLSNGLTLIELLIVVAIIGVIVVPLLLTYRSYRTSQALTASAEAVANHTRSAHIFAREARAQREWGIKNLSDTAYALFSSGAAGVTDEQRYSLDSGVTFVNDFVILFAIGEGSADGNYAIELINTTGNKININVGETGIVEVVRL